MANLLVVEDDEYLRIALKNSLESSGHKVTEAGNGKVAREILKSSPPFDMILSDIQMPFLTGMELLQWVKGNKPCPFVLMTGFALIMETQKAIDLGADEFLSKPFHDKELQEVVKRLVPAKVVEEIKADPVAEFCKVSINEFVTTPKINFDVFIKLGKRFVKVGHKGEDIPVDRINAYKDKGLKFLHIRKEEFRSLVNFSVNVAKKITGSGQVSHEKKVQFLRYTGELILEKAFMVGVDQDSFNGAKDFLTTSLDVLAEEDEAFDLIAQLNSHADHLYAHSLCVSMYATMVAKKMGWESTQQLFRLSLCGLFHDIGKKEIDREILEKSRPQLTVAERQLFESHTTRGRDILIQLKSMPSEVVRVAYEHHEDSAGSGYPLGVRKAQIHPFSQVIRVANLFSEFAMKSPSRAGMSPLSSIEYLKTHFMETIDAQAYGALCKLFSS